LAAPPKNRPTTYRHGWYCPAQAQFQFQFPVPIPNRSKLQVPSAKAKLKKGDHSPCARRSSLVAAAAAAVVAVAAVLAAGTEQDRKSQIGFFCLDPGRGRSKLNGPVGLPPPAPAAAAAPSKPNQRLFGVHIDLITSMANLEVFVVVPQVPPPPRCTPVVISTELASRLPLAPCCAGQASFGRIQAAPRRALAPVGSSPGLVIWPVSGTPICSLAAGLP
jgi:hypothetical protein